MQHFTEVEPGQVLSEKTTARRGSGTQHQVDDGFADSRLRVQLLSKGSAPWSEVETNYWNTENRRGLSIFKMCSKPSWRYSSQAWRESLHELCCSYRGGDFASPHIPGINSLAWSRGFPEKSAAWRGDGGGWVREKHPLNRSKSRRGLLGTEKHSGCSLPSGPTQKSTLAAGCQAQGAAVPHSRSLAPGISPAIYLSSSFAPSLLCQSSTSGCLWTRTSAPPATRGLCDQCKTPSLPVPPASPPVSAISSENPHFVDSVTERKGLRLVQGESWQSRNAQVHKWAILVIKSLPPPLLCLFLALPLSVHTLAPAAEPVGCFAFLAEKKYSSRWKEANTDLALSLAKLLCKSSCKNRPACLIPEPLQTAIFSVSFEN